jgi:transcriptional regulator with XRE-family HTH domain
MSLGLRRISSATPLFYGELEPGYQAARAVIALRATRGLTQEQLATRAHLQRPVLSRIEGAKAMPTIPTLERLAVALNAKGDFS